jgi:hypothetical protein
MKHGFQIGNQITILLDEKANLACYGLAVETFVLATALKTSSQDALWTNACPLIIVVETGTMTSPRSLQNWFASL